MIYEKINVYPDRDDVTLTTYVLDNSVEMLNGEKRGAVLVLPGGAFLYCTDREAEPVAMGFSAQGYHTFVLRYSVYNENKGENTNDNILPDMEKPWVEKPGVIFPGPVLDILKALQIIRNHAEEWRVNMDKIALCGFSAGGYEAAMYAVNWNKPLITDHLGGEAPIRPAAVICGYMMSDYRVFLNVDAGKTLFGASVRAFTGEWVLKDAELADKMSPCLQVDEEMPPTFLWATADDQTADVSQTLKMASALSEKKVPFEMHIFEKGRHGMVLATYATAGDPTQLSSDVAQWLPLAEHWLVKRLAPVFPASHEGF